MVKSKKLAHNQEKAKVDKIVKRLPRFSQKTTIALVVILFLLGLFYFKRQWLVVATVNGQPIWRWQYNQTLEEQYGTQILDQLINKQLIQQKAKIEKVAVDETRIDQEIDQIRQSLGPDNSLEEVLTLQGMTMAGLREEIENQFIIEELLSAGIEITQEEIASRWGLWGDQNGQNERKIPRLVPNLKRWGQDYFFYRQQTSRIKA